MSQVTFLYEILGEFMFPSSTYYSSDQKGTKHFLLASMSYSFQLYIYDGLRNTFFYGVFKNKNLVDHLEDVVDFLLIKVGCNYTHSIITVYTHCLSNIVF